jgi:AcrR family transcriptional regulator
VQEIAEAGLGAPTAKIARRAGLATGTLFTYFANKEKLLNELYLELKIEVYRRVDTNFRLKRIWNGGRGMYGRACSIGPSSSRTNVRFRRS